MGNTSRNNDCIYLPLQSHITGTYLTGYAIKHGIHHSLERFFPRFCLRSNGNHVIQAQVCRKTAPTIQHLFNLKLAILTAETKIHQLTRRNGTGTFCTERAIAIERIIYINYLSFAMSTYRDTTAQMHNNNVQVLVFPPNGSSILTGNCLAVQGMENGFAFDIRNTCIAGFRHELVCHFRVGYVSGALTFFCQFYCYQSAQITGMFHFSMNQVMLYALVNLINAARCRLQQTATGNHCIKLNRNAHLSQHITHKLLAVRQLFNDVSILRQVFQRMVSTTYPYRLIVLVQRQLSRS